MPADLKCSVANCSNSYRVNTAHGDLTGKQFEHDQATTVGWTQAELGSWLCPLHSDVLTI
jgi:hypothetical protein